MPRFEQQKEIYSSFYGLESVGTEVIQEVELALCLRLPTDFTRIASFYGGGFLGGISHHDIAVSGPATNIVAETLRLRKAVGLPTRFVAIAEPAESIIVLDTSSSEVIWCGAFDVHNLVTGTKLHKPQVWQSYSAFFDYLLEEERQERLGQ